MHVAKTFICDYAKFNKHARYGYGIENLCNTLKGMCLISIDLPIKTRRWPRAVNIVILLQFYVDP